MSAVSRIVKTRTNFKKSSKIVKKLALKCLVKIFVKKVQFSIITHDFLVPSVFGRGLQRGSVKSKVR